MEWEQRKKSRAGGSAPCKSRKTVFCDPSPVASDSCHDQASAWLLGDGAETEKSSIVAGVLVLNCFSVVSTMTMLRIPGARRQLLQKHLQLLQKHLSRFRQWLPKSHAQNASCICSARTASIHQSHELFSGTMQDRRCACIVPMMR